MARIDFSEGNDPAAFPHAPPSGMSQAVTLDRQRRIAATYLLGHDRTVWFVPRWLARALSAYERSWLRALVIALLDEWPALDRPFLWLTRRLIFALAARPRGEDDATLDLQVHPSGWRGTVMVLVIWSVVISALVWLLRTWLAA